MVNPKASFLCFLPVLQQDLGLIYSRNLNHGDPFAQSCEAFEEILNVAAWQICGGFGAIFPASFAKRFFPLIVSQLLCQVRPVASIVANYCRLGDHRLWCILLLHGFAARVWVSRKNAAKFPCSKAKFPVTFSCSFCCKEFGQKNHVRSIGSQPHPENKMLEELYGLAPEPGV